MTPASSIQFTETSGNQTPRMSRNVRLLVVFLTFILAVGADQAAKEFAKTHIPRREAVSVLGGALCLQRYENVGGVFSLEYSLPDSWQGTPFTIATSLFMGLLLLILLAAQRLRPLAVISLSLVLAGCSSNFLNRMIPPRIVVDFIEIGWGSFRSSLFNVADAEIAAGLALFSLTILTFLYNRACGILLD